MISSAEKIGVTKLKYNVGIATKLIFMVSFVVITAIAAVVFIATDLFTEDSITKIQESNKDSAHNIAERVLGVFHQTTQKMTLMAQFATKAQEKEDAIMAIQSTLSGDEDLLSFIAYRFNEEGKMIPEFRVTNDVALAQYEITADKLEKQVMPYLWDQQNKNFDEPVVMNSSPYVGSPLFTISFLSSKKKDDKNTNKNPLASRWLFRADIRQDSILKIFSKKEFTSAYLVDAKGRLMAHSDQDQAQNVIHAKELSSYPIVAKMLEGTLNNHQMKFEDDNGVFFLGAYKKVGVAGIGVVAQVEEDKALATIHRVQYRSGLVMIIVVCLAFFVNFAFSQSITSQLTRLFAATNEIVQGNYDVKLKISTSDELGALSHAFISMAGGLREREKLKTAFSKFHSREVAQKLLSGEIKLGGERKHVTVFFSDVRGFTELSEKMTPDEVVSMLNEYMTEMVRIIYKWHGIVDKYVGDAIMAVWGVPETKSDDAYNAVRASLEMRHFLKSFNEARSLKSKPEIKIGVGIHSGEVVSGNIGSEERLEYTVIGDTVNQASRIEAANKPLHADFLISDRTYSLVKERGVEVGPPLQITVKGKSQPLVVYQVLGYQENGILQTSLSKEKIEEIKTQSTVIESEEESKVSLGGSASKSTADKSSHKKPSIKEEAFQEVTAWFVVPDGQSDEYFGPFSKEEIKLKVAQKQIDPRSAYAFKEGDDQMTPLTEVTGISRRATPYPRLREPLPQAEIQEQAESHEWYVYGPRGESLGPYEIQELRDALTAGNLSRTTYVWAAGYEEWIPVFEIPGFDRRDLESAAHRDAHRPPGMPQKPLQKSLRRRVG